MPDRCRGQGGRRFARQSVRQAKQRQRIISARRIEVADLSQWGRRILECIANWDEPTVDGIVELVAAAQGASPVAEHHSAVDLRPDALVFNGTARRQGMTTAGMMPSTEQRRAAARDAYRASLAEGVPLTGAELGRRFGLSPRWGRNRVAEVHAEATAASNGSRPTAHARETTGQDDDRPSVTRQPGGRRTDDADRGAESASAGGNGSSPALARSAASARLQSDGTPSAVPSAVRGTTTFAVLAVAVVAAVASYDHQRALADLAGEGWRAWLIPVSVDGLVVAASMTMLVRRRAGLPAGALAWASLLAGIGASLAANVAAADPTAVGRVVAAWPPVALLLAWELLMQVRAPTRGSARTPPRSR